MKTTPDHEYHGMKTAHAMYFSKLFTFCLRLAKQRQQASMLFFSFKSKFTAFSNEFCFFDWIWKIKTTYCFSSFVGNFICASVNHAAFHWFYKNECLQFNILFFVFCWQFYLCKRQSCRFPLSLQKWTSSILCFCVECFVTFFKTWVVVIMLHNILANIFSHDFRWQREG